MDWQEELRKAENEITWTEGGISIDVTLQRENEDAPISRSLEFGWKVIELRVDP